MNRYPFAAIVGQPELKLALPLASVDWRLSVLLRGDKGSGKSTAARALADILPAGAPFVTFPLAPRKAGCWAAWIWVRLSKDRPN